MDALRARHPDIALVPEPDKSRIYFKEGLDALRRRSAFELFVLAARKGALFFWPFEMVHGFQWWLALALPFAVVGAVTSFRTGSRDEAILFLYAWLLAALLATGVFFHDVRIRYCTEPPIVALAAIGIVSLRDRVRPPPRDPSPEGGPCAS
jgi:hypothetical protein